MDALQQKLPFAKGPVRVRAIISYVLDYVILIALVIAFFILDRIEPFHQNFSLRNIAIQYPFAQHERIPMYTALAITGGAPLLVIALYTIVIDGLFSHSKRTDPATGRVKLMGRYPLKNRLWELNCGVLGLLLSQAAAFVITTALKNAVGKPRPDFIDRCRPRAGSEDGPVFGLSRSIICTQTNPAIIKDGFRSWPSAAFAGLFYLSLYLAGKLHVMDSRGEVWKTFVVTTPALGAALVSATRVMDSRHHGIDIVSGSVLGVVCAWLAYRQYFPPISEAWRKGRAYPMRTWGAIPEPPVYRETRRVDMEDDDEAKPMAHDEEYQGVSSKGYSAQHQQTEVAGPANNPFQPPRAYDRGAQGQGQGNYSSSSGETPGYEMQSGYRGRHQASESQEQLGTGRPADTSYHPPSQQMAAR
ncbi:hypothetical protein LOZ66_002197 [Ophidiomyces ophidiicola]|nr:hypothetical protein LOZ65_000792 [Ophidiomyces ophidiicola]KAI1940601.1 hypothetical protein LOZ66_002197 [Ophidiomyces ophidiicola]